MRRLERGGPFDLAYVLRVRATLNDALSHLDRVDSSRHHESVGGLLTRARNSMRNQRNTARQLEAALQPRVNR